MTFAERLENLLKERKISKAKLLTDLKLGKNQFNYWKKNNSVPNGFTVQDIAKYLDTSVDYLLGRPDLTANDENGNSYIIETMAPNNQKEKPPAEDEELNRFLKLTERLSDENYQKLLDYMELLLNSQK